jgi:MutS domain V
VLAHHRGLPPASHCQRARRAYGPAGMAVRELLGVLRRWGWRWRGRRRAPVPGGTEVADARRLADAERAGGGVPDGCAWLDERTVDDVDLALVFRAIDRTTTPLGAQALWRWLAAPAVRLEVLAARERSLARLAGDPGLRDRVRDALGRHAAIDAPHLPRLLWEPSPPPLRTGGLVALAAALVALAVLAVWWPPLVLLCLLLLGANVLIDEAVSARLAPQAHAFGVLAQVLGSAERVMARGGWRDPIIADDLAVFARFRTRVAWLTVSDPFGIADLVRAGLLVRLLLLSRWTRVIERERDRLRRVVLWTGEVDALVAIASLRAERSDARWPRLSIGATTVEARGLAHPAIAGAVGNDLALDAGLLVTGSNMAGKSTFLRTIAVNAICAQSIHTTFGTWRAGLFRVFSVMRIADATAVGLSTYAVEVAAIGKLVEAVDRRDHGLPALLVIDEPFRGTSPALRVPIAVSVLDYCGARDLVIAATHDLDVAARVDPRFARGYFAEPDGEHGRFDHKLRAGVSPATNALAMLVRAGYPAAIVSAVDSMSRSAGSRLVRATKETT